MFYDTDGFEIKGILLKYKGKDAIVNVPDGVTEIAEGAFEGSEVVEVYLPLSVKKIGANAFKNCSLLKKISFGKVDVFEANAFEGCVNLSLVDFTADIEEWCDMHFSGYTSNPLYYASELYLNGNKIEYLALSCEKINDYAFCGIKVRDLILNAPVNHIGTGAFCDLKLSGNKKELRLPDTLKFVGEMAFRGADVKTLTFSSVERFESWCFFKCALESVRFEGTLNEWLNIYFRDVWSNPLSVAHSLYLYDELIEDLIIPKGVLRIPDAAFAGASIKTARLNDVECVGEVEFYGCANLKKIFCDKEPTVLDSAFEGTNDVKFIFETQ